MAPSEVGMLPGAAVAGLDLVSALYIHRFYHSSTVVSYRIAFSVCY